MLLLYFEMLNVPADVADNRSPQLRTNAFRMSHRPQVFKNYKEAGSSSLTIAHDKVKILPSEASATS